MNWYKKILESEKKSGIILSMAKKEFIIMRGLPGSGKSTLAGKLKGETGVQYAADDYFMDEQGNYNWDANQIGVAHQWNHERIKRAIEQGISPVIMDNTNVSKWDLRQARPLVEYAENQGYEVRIEEANTPWAFNAEELAQRNTHGVPLEAIQKKLQRWHPNPTVEDIRNDFQDPPMAT